MPTITERVLAAQSAMSGLEEVVQSISEMVYHYPVGKPGFTEEDGAEFLLRFYPRIRHLVRRYRPTGSSFDAYLNTSMRWQLRSFAAERSSDQVRLATACDHATANEILGHDGFFAADSSVPPDGDPPLAENARRPGRAARADRPPAKLPAHRPSALRLQPDGDRRDRLSPGEAQRILCMTLKAGDRLDPDLRRRIADVTGCDPGWLEDRWQELREITETLRRRRSRVRTRRDHAWFRTRCVEARIAGAVETERSRLLEEHRRWRERYRRAREELNRMGDGPTHVQIAEVLGIAKGTVDSGIFKARQELRCTEYRQRLARLFDAP